jgi:hypothetical protein
MAQISSQVFPRMCDLAGETGQRVSELCAEKRHRLGDAPELARLVTLFAISSDQSGYQEFVVVGTRLKQAKRLKMSHCRSQTPHELPRSGTRC